MPARKLPAEINKEVKHFWGVKCFNRTVAHELYKAFSGDICFPSRLLTANFNLRNNDNNERTV